MKNLLVAQSGGPTSAINATLAGVIENALSSPSVDKIYGSVNGIQGVLNENLIDLKIKITNVSELDLLCQTPASALGSCRVKLKDPARMCRRIRDNHLCSAQIQHRLLHLHRWK